MYCIKVSSFLHICLTLHIYVMDIIILWNIYAFMHTYAYLWRYILSYCGTSTVPAFSSLIYKIYLTFYDWDGLWLLDMSKVKSFQFSCELGTTLSLVTRKT